MLKKDDLRVGMRVVRKDLINVYDTYIILKDIVGYGERMVGTIVCIADSCTDEVSEQVLSGGYCVYNDGLSMDLEVSYDE